MPTSVEEPLLISSSSANANEPNILVRISAILILLVISFWANYEASKTFEITIKNSAAMTPASHLFQLNFVSNGRATRIIYHTSQSVQKILYPDESFLPRKPINHVTLQLSTHNLTTLKVDVTGNYIIQLSHVVMSKTNVVVSALQRAVARLWLWDGQQQVPDQLVEAMVDYLVGATDEKIVGVEFNRYKLWSVGFLKYCEEKKGGFVAELNRSMRHKWSESVMEEILGECSKDM